MPVQGYTLHILSVSVCVALLMQHAKRLRSITLSSVACPTHTAISTLSHKRHEFMKNKKKKKNYVLNFSTNFVRNISHSQKNSARYDHKRTSVFMYSTDYCCQSVMELEFSRQTFEKKTLK